jgi:hypothetical protein
MSLRTLTAGIISEINADTVRPVMLVELDFSSGYVRCWTGYGPLTWDSKTWTGTGTLGKVSDIGETASFQANGVGLQLDGIPSAMLSIALGEHYQSRPARVWLAFLTEAGAVIADPFLIFSGVMDTMQIAEGGEVASITLQTESRAIDLKRSKERRFTHDDQQIDYPGDLGFEYVAALQDKQVIWKPAS